MGTGPNKKLKITPPPQKKNQGQRYIFFLLIEITPIFYDNFKCFIRVSCTQKEDNRFHYQNSKLLYYIDKSTKIYAVFLIILNIFEKIFKENVNFTVGELKREREKE